MPTQVKTIQMHVCVYVWFVVNLARDLTVRDKEIILDRKRRYIVRSLEMGDPLGATGSCDVRHTDPIS